eukprot:535306-Pyramimonas_sp.AAC.1
MRCGQVRVPRAGAERGGCVPRQRGDDRGHRRRRPRPALRPLRQLHTGARPRKRRHISSYTSSSTIAALFVRPPTARLAYRMRERLLLVHIVLLYREQIRSSARGQNIFTI